MKLLGKLFRQPALPDDTLTLYRTNRFYYWLSHTFNGSGLHIFGFVALFLFGVPALLNVLNGTAVNLAISQRLASIPLLGTISAALLSTDPDKLNIQLPFFLDRGMIIFLLLLYPAHTVLLLRFWDTIPILFKKVNEDGTLLLPDPLRVSIIRVFNARVNNRTQKLLALGIAIACTSWIYFYGRAQMDWWGKTQYGPLGVIAFAVPILFIWYQLFLHNLKGIATIKFFREVFRREYLNLDLYHADGCYGLGGLLPRALMTNYLTTLIHMASVYVILQFGFIHKQFDLFLLILLTIFLIFVPLFHLLPYFLIRRQICELIEGELSRIRQLARKNYEIIRSSDGSSADYLQAVQNIGALQQLHERIDSMKRHPYGTSRIRVAIFSYVLPLVPIGFKFYDILFAKRP
jgi:hypothetical protein